MPSTLVVPPSIGINHTGSETARSSAHTLAHQNPERTAGNIVWWTMPPAVDHPQRVLLLSTCPHLEFRRACRATELRVEAVALRWASSQACCLRRGGGTGEDRRSSLGVATDESRGLVFRKRPDRYCGAPD